MQAVGRGLARAAADRGLAFRVELADNSSNRMNQQVEAILAEWAGAVVIAPVDSDAVSRRLLALDRAACRSLQQRKAQQGAGLAEGDTTTGAVLLSPYGFGAFGQVHVPPRRRASPTLASRSNMAASSAPTGAPQATASPSPPSCNGERRGHEQHVARSSSVGHGLPQLDRGRSSSRRRSMTPAQGWMRPERLRLLACPALSKALVLLPAIVCRAPGADIACLPESGHSNMHLSRPSISSICSSEAESAKTDVWFALGG